MNHCDKFTDVKHMAQIWVPLDGSPAMTRVGTARPHLTAFVVGSSPAEARERLLSQVQVLAETSCHPYCSLWEKAIEVLCQQP